MPKLPDVLSLGERPTPRVSGGVASYDAGQVAQAKGNLGNTLFGIGEDLYKIAEKERERIDNTRTEDALNKLLEYDLDARRGEKGFKRVVGEQAATRPIVQEYSREYENKITEIAASLENPKQQESFRKKAAIFKRSFSNAVYEHQSHESDRFGDETFKNSLALARRSITENMDDTSSMGANLARFERLIQDEKTRSGYSQAWLDMQRALIDSDRAMAAAAKAGEIIDSESRKVLVDADSAVERFESYKGWVTNLKLKDQSAVSRLIEAGRRDIANAAMTGIVHQHREWISPYLEAFLKSKNLPDAKYVVIEHSPDGKEKIRVNVPWNLLDAKEQARWAREAATESKQGDAVARHSLNIRLRDAEAAARQGYPIAPLTPADLAPIKDQRERDAILSEHGARIKLSETVRGLAGKTLAEMAATVNEFMPKTEVGFVERSKDFEAARSAFEALKKQMRDDAADYAIRTNQGVRIASEAFFKNPADPVSAKSYIDEVVAHHSRIGISGFPVLTNSHAQAIVDTYKNMEQDAQIKTPSMDFIQAQRRIFGEHWPKVVQQIGKDLSPTARVIAELPSSQAAQTLAGLERIKTEVLKKNVESLGKGVDTDIETSVEVAMRPFIASMIGTGRDAHAVSLDWTDAAKRLAFHNAISGRPVKDVVRDAVESLVGNQFVFKDDGLGRVLRIPKSVNADDVISGTRLLLSTIENVPVRVPENAVQMFGEPFTKEQFAQLIKREGYFKASSDDTGVNLFARDRSGTEFVVLQPNGTPVFYSWEFVSSRKREAPMRIPGSIYDPAPGVTRESFEGRK